MQIRNCAQTTTGQIEIQIEMVAKSVVYALHMPRMPYAITKTVNYHLHLIDVWFEWRAMEAGSVVKEMLCGCTIFGVNIVSI